MLTKDDTLRLCDIYKKGSSPVNYFNIPLQSYQLLIEFSEKRIGQSELFNYYWNQNLLSISSSEFILNLAKGELDHPEGFFKEAFDVFADKEKIEFRLPLSLSEIVLYLLIPSLNGTYQGMMQLILGHISIHNAANHMDLCKDFKMELFQLGSFFNVKISDKDIEFCSKRLECARNMKTCVEQSNAILQTAEVLELDGDFSSIEQIKNKVTLLLYIIEHHFN